MKKKKNYTTAGLQKPYMYKILQTLETLGTTELQQTYINSQNTRNFAATENLRVQNLTKSHNTRNWQLLIK